MNSAKRLKVKSVIKAKSDTYARLFEVKFLIRRFCSGLNSNPDKRFPATLYLPALKIDPRVYDCVHDVTDKAEDQTQEAEKV